MSFKADVLAAAKKNVNVKGFIQDLLSGPINTALNELVNRSPNKFDDMAKSALYPLLSEEIYKALTKLWESATKVEAPAAPVPVAEPVKAVGQA